ncbi:MAG: MarR family transcriptional regulator [Leptospiraceae bacterium]|nr:MarR family transcriptional regulator [Leptospiraceae bacterium]
MPTKFTGKETTRLALDAFIKINRCTNSLVAQVASSLAPHNLTLSQFAVLEALLFNGEMRSGEISHKILKSGGNITKVVDNLEKMGMVTKKRSNEDARCHLVKLTETGTKKIKLVFPDIRDKIEAMMNTIAPEEILALSTITRKLGTEVSKESLKNNKL